MKKLTPPPFSEGQGRHLKKHTIRSNRPSKIINIREMGMGFTKAKKVESFFKLLPSLWLNLCMSKCNWKKVPRKGEPVGQT